MGKRLVCPVHKLKLRLCGEWQPPEGYDPKMKRYACMDCVEYWYWCPDGWLRRLRDIRRLQIASACGRSGVKN